MEPSRRRRRRRANKRGSAETLREYWTQEGHPGPTHFGAEKPIAWGQGDDFYRCVEQVMAHTDMTKEQAQGYCNLRHHEATGMWTSQHAEAEGKLDYDPVAMVRKWMFNPNEPRIAAGNVQGGEWGQGPGSPSNNADRIADANAAAGGNNQGGFGQRGFGRGGGGGGQGMAALAGMGAARGAGGGGAQSGGGGSQGGGGSSGGTTGGGGTGTSGGGAGTGTGGGGQPQTASATPLGTGTGSGTGGGGAGPTPPAPAPPAPGQPPSPANIQQAHLYQQQAAADRQQAAQLQSQVDSLKKQEAVLNQQITAYNTQGTGAATGPAGQNVQGTGAANPATGTAGTQPAGSSQYLSQLQNQLAAIQGQIAGDMSQIQFLNNEATQLDQLAQQQLGTGQQAAQAATGKSIGATRMSERELAIAANIPGYWDQGGNRRGKSAKVRERPTGRFRQYQGDESEADIALREGRAHHAMELLGTPGSNTRLRSMHDRLQRRTFNTTARQEMVTPDITKNCDHPGFPHAFIVKVGAEGFVHGYICVRPPCGGPGDDDSPKTEMENRIDAANRAGSVASGFASAGAIARTTQQRGSIGEAVGHREVGPGNPQEHANMAALRQRIAGHEAQFTGAATRKPEGRPPAVGPAHDPVHGAHGFMAAASTPSESQMRGTGGHDFWGRTPEQNAAAAAAHPGTTTISQSQQRAARAEAAQARQAGRKKKVKAGAAS